MIRAATANALAARFLLFGLLSRAKPLAESVELV
jgi:hypothetical protein